MMLVLEICLWSKHCVTFDFSLPTIDKKVPEFLHTMFSPRYWFEVTECCYMLGIEMQ
jgi:hypothetical protein